MGFSAWITSTGDADYTYYPCYHSTQKGKPGNRSFFDNPKADELIEKGRSLSDPEARKEVYPSSTRSSMKTARSCTFAIRLRSRPAPSMSRASSATRTATTGCGL